jgi:hypothetical protein
VEQVLDALDAVDLVGLVGEAGDPGVVGDHAAQVDDAGLHVDRHVALRGVGRAEDLGLDLAGERHVVDVLDAMAAGHAGRGGRHGTLRLARGVAGGGGRLLHARVHLGGRLFAHLVPAATAALRVEEVREGGADRDAEQQRDESAHQWLPSQFA